MKNSNGSLNRLLAVPVALIFLELLLELTHCFLFFGAGSDCLEANVLTRWINPKALWTELFVTANNGGMHTERSHTCILRILLQILSHSGGEYLDRDLILELHLVLSADTSQVLH